MKYGIVVILLSLTIPAFSRDAVFSEFAMGMSTEEVTARYPNLRFETGDAWISLGNAVFTRCYIDVQEGLYRVESSMREEDQDFITALEDAIAQKHGGPIMGESGSAWSVDRGNRFDDPDTCLIEIYQQNGFLIVVKEFKNAPAV